MDRDPNSVALVTSDMCVTYGELEDRANQLTHYLEALGIGQDARVGILLHRSVHTYVSMLAVLKAGGAFVPIDAASPPDRVAYIAEDASLDLIISSSDLAGPVAGLSCRILDIDTAAAVVDSYPRVRLAVELTGNPTCYIIYTSGSTGRPKGVEVAQSSICNFIRVVSEIYDVRPDDRVYQGMTISFDFSIEEIWPTFAVGATLVVGPNDSRRLGAELADFLDDTAVTVFYCVPTLLSTIDRDLPAVRTLIVGGEACPPELVERWKGPGRRILNTYGPTEATVTATCGELRAGRPVTIGRPLPTYTVVLLNENMEQVRHGEIGEICIGGLGVARGYIGQPDLTADRFIQHPAAPDGGRLYRTGDLGRVLYDGEIEYCGRADTQVKIRGYRVELTEIESVLAQIPGIAQAVVDTYEAEPGLAELVAYYRLQPHSGGMDKQQIYTTLRERMPAYMIPVYLELLDPIPVLPSDKVDRKRLPKPTGPRSIAAQQEYVPPATRAERILAEALAEVVRVNRVSVESHFFDDLGANSLLMAHFCTAIRRRDDMPPVSMRDVYLNPTVRGLAGALLASAPEVAGEPAGQTVRPVRSASTAQYVLCSALQFLLFFGFAYLSGLVLVAGFRWTTAGVDLIDVYLRAIALSLVLMTAQSLLPILVKWVLIGRWKEREIPIWSLGYVRFWLVKTLVRSSPLVMSAGSPLYVLYLRALGARIGRGVVILTRNIPVCTDLLTIGADTVIRKDTYVNCYRAASGLIQTGPVVLGRDVLVGEKSVLDVGTRMGDGAQLGHVSSLHTSQVVPAGDRWHGSPAQRTNVDYRSVAGTRCGTIRRAGYGSMQLLSMTFLATPLAIVILIYAARIPWFGQVLDNGHANLATLSFYTSILAGTSVLFFGGLLVGLVLVLTVPRVLNLALTSGRIYPLYGIHYWIQRTISRMTNSRVYMRIFGDSSYIVHYLRALGWDLSGVEQTGSNFGVEQKHESPFLCSVSPGTMVSDGLSMMNANFSNTSFSVSRVAIGPNSFFGNDIVYPPGARLGDNCLLGTKTMVPLDGPVREGIGLLGSPSFEIPRSVERDSRFDHLKSGDEFRRRLVAKNRHNLVTIGLFLLAQWFGVYLMAVIGLAAVDLFSDMSTLTFPVATVVILAVSMTYAVLLERAAGGFRSLTPQFCSIYDRYFWWHERYWKMFAPNPFNGTPLKGLVWRSLGVRIGRRVFDDGCGIIEKTLVTIGDDCTLNTGSVIQCHSLEDGTFKSDYTRLGRGCTLGVAAFVHYGVTMSDGTVLAPDSFLMKGEEIPSHTVWGGNPARVLGAFAPAR